MSSTQTEIINAEKPKEQWLDKYSNELANFFGGVLVLAAGCIFFIVGSFVISFFSQVSDSGLANTLYGLKGEGTTFAIILSSLLLGILSGWVMFHFSNKVIVSGEELRESSIYVLSEWTPRTLKAAGVPDDITECLDEILGKKNKNGIDRSPLTTETFTNGWIMVLKEKLGKTRVAEFEETILKYTRQEKPVKKDESDAGENTSD